MRHAPEKIRIIRSDKCAYRIFCDAVAEKRLILRHRLLADPPRRYQQHEEKEGFESGLWFHGGMVVESLNRLFVDLFGRDGGVKKLRVKS